MLQLFLVSFFVLGGLAACGQSTEGGSNGDADNQSTQEEQEQQVEVKITKNNGEEVISEKEVEIEDGMTVMEVMEANFNLEAGNDGFITAIEGVSPEDGEKKAWFYTVNGEEAMVGAKDYKLEAGDSVTFDFHSWE
nr:DUF4430 domain-containing protein [Pontibacillus sp. HN14]